MPRCGRAFLLKAASPQERSRSRADWTRTAALRRSHVMGEDGARSAARSAAADHLRDPGPTRVEVVRLASLALCIPPLATVGVRVSLTNGEGPGPWSQIVTILVV